MVKMCTGKMNYIHAGLVLPLQNGLFSKPTRTVSAIVNVTGTVMQGGGGDQGKADKPEV